MDENRLIVIGAGASGMMAAGRAAQLGASVLLLEKMEQPGKKILISGKRRCNVTNTREMEDFIEAYGANGRFLYSAFSRFFRDDLLALLNKYGVQTKTERGGRIFPESDNARDVIRAFERYMSEHNVHLKTGIKAIGISVENGTVTGVRTEKTCYPASAVVLATGGSSFPATGSAGDGYRIAESSGHSVVKLRPALVPLEVVEVEVAKSMQGVSLRNVRLTAYSCRSEDIDSAGKQAIIASQMGEMMITHFGIGGPITLQMSLTIVDALGKGPASISIDLKPGLEIKQLRQRLQRDFDRFSQRSFSNILKELLPRKMIDPLVQFSGIPPDKPGYGINAGERDRLAGLLKSLRFNISRPLPLSAAMVTAGGVSLKEIDPRTMASRLIKGLFFCGEVIDIQADTGGFNLQAAFSTGFTAGESAAAFVTSAHGKKRA
jgi:predicted Rossmann fold flavoprotein